MFPELDDSFEMDDLLDFSCSFQLSCLKKFIDKYQDRLGPQIAAVLQYIVDPKAYFSQFPEFLIWYVKEQYKQRLSRILPLMPSRRYQQDFFAHINKHIFDHNPGNCSIKDEYLYIPFFYVHNGNLYFSCIKDAKAVFYTEASQYSQFIERNFQSEIRLPFMIDFFPNFNLELKSHYGKFGEYLPDDFEFEDVVIPIKEVMVEFLKKIGKSDLVGKWEALMSSTAE
ncbi:hypothetical protein [Thermoflavifilum thermophilum]|uniref:Uncharacterized protein n=1 Tax=Thermoflavifilum thermophilum TaxID=1393122 RepID=A0A1I7MXG0_9BACT|nr:hypothetical protein [Thermoflavifilum thermophilum]SFV27101.1 hypothetical protein SAMN05660895_0037 [Thermoflavifilum thermophilum]